MAATLRVAAALLLISACGFPRPPDVPGASDAASGDGAPIDAAPSDVPDLPGVTLHVSPTGDDANDGFTQPLKTLKHAIGLAAANSAFKNIVLASGRYSTALGETFPYTVPANLTIIGPAGGGAILTGSTAEAGMIVDTGTLRDLELEDFTVAITATGTAHVTNVHVRTSGFALRAETSAKVTVDNLDITGTLAACATGIILNGAADLEATTLATRSLGIAISARDQSIANVTHANVTGDSSCMTSVLDTKSSGLFAISDSLLDGGFDGASLGPTPGAAAAQATLARVMIRNTKRIAVSGTRATLNISECEFSRIGGTAIDIGQSTLTLINDTFTQNTSLAIFAQESTLTMRGSNLSGNGAGVDVSLSVATDLGTVTNPGNNLFQNTEVGIFSEGRSNGALEVIDAVGNTWWPGVQGANQMGQYGSRSLVSGPIAGLNGNNFGLSSDMGHIQL